MAREGSGPRLVMSAPIGAVLLWAGLLSAAVATESLDPNVWNPSIGCNRVIHLHVHAARIESVPPAAAHWGGFRHRLTLDLEFENRIASDLVLQLGYPDTVTLGPLERQLFLQLDDSKVFRAVPNSNFEGEIALKGPGASARGLVHFPWPDEGADFVALHYEHSRLGPLKVAVRGNAGQEAAASGDALVGHELFQLELRNIEFVEQVLGKSAPTGMQWLVADLRGRSNWSVDRSARLFSPSAGLDDRRATGRAMEYLNAAAMLLAVVDDQEAYLRELSLGTLEPDPVFLPGRFLGGRVVFPVPITAQKVEIVAYAGVAAGEGLSGEEPPPLRMPVLGEGRSSPGQPILFGFEDGPLRLDVHHSHWLDEDGEVHPNEAERLLAIDFLMSNESSRGGMMRLLSRLQLMGADGQPSVPGYRLLQGPEQEVAEPFWLPAGEVPRRLTVLFRVPQQIRSERLVYTGVTGTFEHRLVLP